MPGIKNKKFETFGDGLLTICEAEDRKLIQNKIEHVRYGNRTIGVSRFWQAKTAGNKVDKLLSIPLDLLNLSQVNVHDIIILENEEKGKGGSGQYEIIQIQQKFDAEPPTLYLSLEKLVHTYKDRRNIGGG
ncbi:hypothetical protein C808_00088 [Lachnospiraceae bacterium M18-1]|nr:hypothetical protein C808_00088 [Lachnospiraceae bacterium M18-1]